MKMNNIKGFGFRPSDEELIGYLQDITHDRDSLVQFITQLEEICKFEPWELPGFSVLQAPDCKVWYFIYSLNYKYQNGKLIKRVTKEGYWKSTGKLRKVMASDTKAKIGSKRSLVFHKGRPKSSSSKKSKTRPENNRDKTKHGRNNKNKAVWVMHEYQLNTATPPNQKTFLLGKLMKNSEEASINSNKKGESSRHSSTNLRNQVAKNTTTPEDQDQSDFNEPLTEVEEVSNDSGGVQNRSSTNEQADNDTQNDETCPQENSSQHNFVDNLGNYAAVYAISRDSLDHTSGLLSNGSAVVQNQFSSSEYGNPSQNLIVIDNNKTYPEERAENESSNWLASFENDDAENFYPMDLSDYDLCNVDELLTLIETPDNRNVLQNQSSTNEQDAETRNSLP